jgi:hypothetical protein
MDCLLAGRWSLWFPSVWYKSHGAAGHWAHVLRGYSYGTVSAVPYGINRPCLPAFVLFVFYRRAEAVEGVYTVYICVSVRASVSVRANVSCLPIRVYVNMCVRLSVQCVVGRQASGSTTSPSHLIHLISISSPIIPSGSLPIHSPIHCIACSYPMPSTLPLVSSPISDLRMLARVQYDMPICHWRTLLNINLLRARAMPSPRSDIHKLISRATHRNTATQFCGSTLDWVTNSSKAITYWNRMGSGGTLQHM